MNVWDDHPVLRLLGGGLVLVVSLFLAALLAWQLARDLAIWVLGRDVEAEVVDLWVEQVGAQDEGELDFQYYMTYRFATPGGETITETTTLSVAEWAGGYEEGGRVGVVYFPPYPKHNRLDDSRFVPALACSYVPAILVAVALVVAGWQLFRPAIQEPGGEWEVEDEKERENAKRI